MSGFWRVLSTGTVLSLVCAGGRPPDARAWLMPRALSAEAAVTIRAETTRSSSTRLTSVEQGQLAALYRPGAYTPFWVDESGHANRDAHETLAMLTGAASDGLDPGDYEAATLERLSLRLDAAGAPRPADVVVFELALTLRTLRYFEHLRFGRVDPAAMRFPMPARAPEDLVEALRAAIAGHRIPAAAAELAPAMALYRQLRSALARYRTIEADPARRSYEPPLSGLRPGDSSGDLSRLHDWLVALGDLPASADRVVAAAYEGTLVDGVKRFQTRHGLRPDGVIGAGTRAALAVPLSGRIRQIELALERLRWLPRLDQERFLAVNIPMFRVWGMEGRPGDRVPSFTSDVIVGRALDTQTPVLVEDMEHVIFRPYWNVPASILRHEILPALSRSPDYLARHDMEIVSGESDGATVLPVTASALERLRRGTLRVRQRPGAGNSLGLVKFVFPNDQNVYMHGTPAPQLFNQARRDFSHGCIRVADPAGLAAWVLSDQPDWTRERIESAMHARRSLRVELMRPIPVILFYLTAIVMPDGGSLHFAEDIYGHDERLEQQLAQRHAS